jgi:HK97 family phage prohead protease
MKTFKSFEYEVKDVDEKGTVVFYANAFTNRDSDGDISMPGSFDKTLNENRRRLRHLKWHDTRYMPGAIKEIGPDDYGLLVKSQLILNTQLGKETYEEYKALAAVGQRMEHSVAVSPIKFADKNGAREVYEWKLYEVSTLNAWGANELSITSEIKSLKDITREDLEKDIALLRALIDIKSYDDLKCEEIERQINYLLELKAAKQPEQDATTGLSTLNEWREMLNLNN